jgi:hypothetical protein
VIFTGFLISEQRELKPELEVSTHIKKSSWHRIKISFFAGSPLANM